jgi:hypothetical protein
MAPGAALDLEHLRPQAASGLSISTQFKFKAAPGPKAPGALLEYQY